MDKVLISACLLGRPVRYDGRDKRLSHPLLERWRREGRLVPVCPEVMAGFPTPRPPAEIAPGGDGAAVLEGTAGVFEAGGREVSDQFRAGARRALATARAEGCRYALLTDGSPSCGARFISGGAFDGTRVDGQGVVTALLEAEGIRVFPETEIDRLAALLDRGEVRT